MKAEQRKELETNTLADKMGQAAQRLKTSPRRTFTIYLIVGAVLLVALWVTYGWYLTNRRDESERWVKLYDGSASLLSQLSDKDKDTNAGKAARFQIAWLLYWNEGVKMLGNDAPRALHFLRVVGKEYDKLAEECKDDPIFEPQALLGRAVVEETLAIEARSHLDKATEYYGDVVKKYEKSVEGKFAQGRLDELKSEKKRVEVAEVYANLQRELRVMAPQAPPALNEPFPGAAKKDSLP